jgi:hypothetical protein
MRLYHTDIGFLVVAFALGCRDAPPPAQQKIAQQDHRPAAVIGDVRQSRAIGIAGKLGRVR